MSYDTTTDKIKARAGKHQVKALIPEQMAFWHEDRRAIANELARSALFTCRDIRKPRQFFDNVTLFMLGEGNVTYKGEELRSFDEDLFVTFAHLAREKTAGKMLVRVTSSELCKLNNWRQDQRYYNNIYLSIQRMKGGVISVFSKRLGKAIRAQRAVADGASPDILARLHEDLSNYDGESLPRSNDNQVGGMMLSLVSGDTTATGICSIKDGVPQGNLTWEITLDENLVALFAKPYLTLVDVKAREKLAGTGRRLQSYFSSHKDPFPVTMRSLEKMLGLNIKELSNLKLVLLEQLTALQRFGVLEKFTLSKTADKKDWLVTVVRPKKVVIQGQRCENGEQTVDSV